MQLQLHLMNRCCASENVGDNGTGSVSGLELSGLELSVTVNGVHDPVLSEHAIVNQQICRDPRMRLNPLAVMWRDEEEEDEEEEEGVDLDDAVSRPSRYTVNLNFGNEGLESALRAEIILSCGAVGEHEVQGGGDEDESEHKIDHAIDLRHVRQGLDELMQWIAQESGSGSGSTTSSTISRLSSSSNTTGHNGSVGHVAAATEISLQELRTRFGRAVAARAAASSSSKDESESFEKWACATGKVADPVLCLAGLLAHVGVLTVLDEDEC